MLVEFINAKTGHDYDLPLIDMDVIPRVGDFVHVIGGQPSGQVASVSWLIDADTDLARSIKNLPRVQIALKK